MCNDRRAFITESKMDVGGTVGAPIKPDHATLTPANALVGMLKIGEAKWLKNWLAQ